MVESSSRVDQWNPSYTTLFYSVIRWSWSAVRKPSWIDHGLYKLSDLTNHKCIHHAPIERTKAASLEAH